MSIESKIPTIARIIPCFVPVIKVDKIETNIIRMSNILDLVPLKSKLQNNADIPIPRKAAEKFGFPNVPPFPVDPSPKFVKSNPKYWKIT